MTLGCGMGVVNRPRPYELSAIIAQLFSQGQQGVMYVPQPVVLGRQVLYQDSAGNTPVTADGDPVGLMLDLSGNGNHAAQSTSAARPTYRTDGTRHWLEFDGVDDKLPHDDLPVPVNYAIAAVGLRVTSYPVSYPLIYSNRHGSFDDQHRMPLVHVIDSNPDKIVTQWGSSPNPVKLDNGSPISDLDFAVRTEYGPVNESNWLNGVLGDSASGKSSLTAGTNNTSGLSPAVGYTGRIYAVVVGMEVPQGHGDSVDAYVAQLMGLTL